MGIKRPSFSAAAAASQINYETVYLNGGHIDILSGSQPVGGPDEDITTQTVLCTFSLQNPAFSNPVNGEASVNGAPLTSSPAVATGTASWFRAYGGAGLPVIDGTVGTGTEFDINLDTVDIVTGTTYTLDTLSIVGGVGVPIQTIQAQFTRTSDGATLGLDDVPIGRTRLTDPVTGQPSNMSVWRSGDGYDCVFFENAYIGLATGDIAGHQYINCKGVVISDEDVILYPYTPGVPRWGTNPTPIPVAQQKRWALPNFQPDAVPTSKYTAAMDIPPAYDDKGLLPSSLGATGAAAHIGLMPNWEVPYFFTDSANDAQVLRHYADTLHVLHLWYVDPATNELARIADHPNISEATDSGMFVGKGGSNPVNNAQQFSHFPAACFGSCIAFETDYDRLMVQSCAMHVAVTQNNHYRDDSYGTSDRAGYTYAEFPQGSLCNIIRTGQTRGNAWGLRSVAQAVAILPEEEPYLTYKNDFRMWLNLAYDIFTTSGRFMDNPFNYLRVDDVNLHTGGAANDTVTETFFQENFYVMTVDYIAERLNPYMPQDWKPVRDWKAMFTWKYWTEFSSQWPSQYRTRSVRFYHDTVTPSGRFPETYENTMMAALGCLSYFGYEGASKDNILAILANNQQPVDLGNGLGHMTGATGATGYSAQWSATLSACVNAGFVGAGGAWNKYLQIGQPSNSERFDDMKFNIYPVVPIPADTQPDPIPAYQPPSKSNIQAGFFYVDAANPTVTVSGLGFTPQAVMIFGQKDDSLPPKKSETSLFSVGMFDADTQACVKGSDIDGLALSNAESSFESGACYSVLDSNGTVYLSLTRASMNADGFTLNVTTAPTENMALYYIAFGGAGIGAAVVEDTTPAATGVHTVTSGLSDVTALLTIGSGNASLQTTLGFSNMSGGVSIGNYSGTGISPTVAKTFMSTSNLVTMISGVDTVAEAVAQNAGAGDFSLTYSKVPATTSSLAHLALSGLQAHIGTYTTTAEDTITTVSGIPFQPKALVLLSSWDSVSDALKADARTMLSVCTDDYQQNATMSWYTADGAAVSSTYGFSHPFVMAYPKPEDASGPQSEFITFTTDGFQVLFPITYNLDIVSMTVHYIAFG